MSLLTSLKKRSTLDAAIKQVAKARKSEGNMAEQLYKGAYQGFASVVADNLMFSEALYHWGFALLHEAETQQPDQAIETLEDAVSKFSFCLLTAPTYLGAAIDGGVAFMSLARLSSEDSKEYLYKMSRHFFEKAGTIQKGSAAYNLACIDALQGDEAACKAALQLAAECGSLPDLEAILHDTDLSSIQGLSWFKEFVESVRNTPPPEPKREKEQPINYEPAFNLKKSEDFDYYSK